MQLSFDYFEILLYFIDNLALFNILNLEEYIFSYELYYMY